MVTPGTTASLSKDGGWGAEAFLTLSLSTDKPLPSNQLDQGYPPESRPTESNPT